MPTVYEIRLEGRLDPRWSEWLDGMTITPLESGETQLTGPVADQAALYGLLNCIRDLNLILISIEKKEGL
jgi:hypothetical protein